MSTQTRNNSPLHPGLGWDEQIFFYGDTAGADDGAQWAVPWSDLMMTMFILFAMLFIFVSSKRDVFYEVLVNVAREKTGQKNDEIETGTYSRQIRMQIAGRGDNATLLATRDQTTRRVLVPPVEQPRPHKKEAAIFFRSARASLEPTARQLLRDFGSRLRASSLRVHLVGHGDKNFVPTADFATNLDLALARATEVARFLAERCGVDRNRILVSGQGAVVPLVPGNSKSSQARNRRVELLFM